MEQGFWQKFWLRLLWQFLFASISGKALSAFVLIASILTLFVFIVGFCSFTFSYFEMQWPLIFAIPFTLVAVTAFQQGLAAAVAWLYEHYTKMGNPFW